MMMFTATVYMHPYILHRANHINISESVTVVLIHKYMHMCTTIHRSNHIIG